MSTPPSRRSLATRLSLSMGLSSAVLSMLVLGLVAVLYFQRAHSSMDENARNSAAFLAESLEYPLWNLDLEAVQAIGQALAQDREVGLVEVTGTLGEALYVHRTQHAILMERRAKVVHDGQVIGWVRVGLNDLGLRATLWPLVLTGAGLAGLILLLQYLLHRFYFRPLMDTPFSSLDRMVSAYSAGDFSSPPPPAPYAEFAPLFRLLADMGRTIQRQMDDLKASQERLSLAMDAANDGLWDWDVASGATFFSPRYYTMLGCQPGEFEGRYEAWRSRVHPDDLERVERALASCIEGVLDVFKAELRMRDKDGRWRWILTRGKVVERNLAGRAKRFVGTHVDITARKELELRLADQLAFQQALMDTIPYAVFYKGADTRFLGFNTAYEEMFGVRREELLGKRVLDLEYLPGADRVAYQAEDEEVIACGGRVQKEMPIPFADGVVHQTLYSVSGFPSADGSPGGLIGVIVDIAARKQAEAALAASEKKYRAIFDTTPVGIFRTSFPGRLLDANPAMARMLGYASREELFAAVGDLGADVYAGPGERRRMLDALLASPGGMSMEIELKQKDGTPIYAIINASLQFDAQGNPAFLNGTIEDITARKHAEAALRQSEEKFSRLFRLSPDNIVVTDLVADRIVDVNESFVATTGFTREEVLGRNAVEMGIFADPANRREIMELLQRDGKVVNYEFEARTRQGAPVSCALSAQVLDIDGRPHMLSMTRDITETKKMQEVMVQTEKMISVGGIAAGVAHEINNPLGIILQATQNLVRRTDPGLPRNVRAAEELGLDMGLLRRYLQARKLDVFIGDIQSAAVRAAAIIRHMLDFSRRSESKRAVCDLPGIVRKAIDLAKSDYDLKRSYDFKRIRIDMEIGDGLPEIQCTETEIEQVILNLLRNAAQAMAAADPPVAEPRIGIRLSALDRGVRIEVEDNGPGILPEVQRRVFEPFFTTKAPGVGTGLGLSVSYFIVTKGHGGKMRVESTPGCGTLFTMDLPTEDART